MTIFERDPAPGGMLRYGIPQYRLPKVEVLEAEYESVTRLGGKMRCNQELGRDFTLDDLQNQGFDAVLIAIGCYDTNKLGIPDEDADGVIDGLEYLRTATLGLPYPGHAGTRVVVIGGGFTAMDCVRTSVRQGAGEVTLVYRRDMKDMPASSEVHEAIEEGVTAIFQAGPTRVITDESRQGRRASSSSGCSWASPTRPAAAARSPPPGTEFIIPCDRVLLAIGQGPDLRWFGPGYEGLAATRNRRLQADAVTFETGPPGRLRHRRRPDRRRDRGPGHRRGPPRRLRGGRLPARATTSPPIRTRQTLAEPQPEFLSIVPFTGEIKEPRYRLKALEAEARNTQLRRVRDPVHAATRPSPSPPAASSAPARRSGSATCAAWASSTARRSRPWRRASTRAPATGPSPRTGSRASTTTTSATTATRSSCASPPAASTAAAAPTCAPRSWAPPATTSCASASTPW